MAKKAKAVERDLIICCDEDQNVSSFEAVNRTGWAACCNGCGRTWMVEGPDQSLLRRDRVRIGGEA